jgi:hypothetical protein
LQTPSARSNRKPPAARRGSAQRIADQMVASVSPLGTHNSGLLRLKKNEICLSFLHVIDQTRDVRMGQITCSKCATGSSWPVRCVKPRTSECYGALSQVRATPGQLVGRMQIKKTVDECDPPPVSTQCRLQAVSTIDFLDHLLRRSVIITSWAKRYSCSDHQC